MINGLTDKYENLHIAIDKFTNGEVLNETEKTNLIKILEAAKGNIIPTKEELTKYKKDVKELGIAMPGSACWSKVHPSIEEVEKKYPQHKDMWNVEFTNYFGTPIGYTKE